ncbi:MAG: formylglycine-generating enzyme family protein, partial [Bacteroidales bacterium]|nr:formylglycine-generating enzyme family protein [Bacteroidales bacterium]
DMIENEEIQVGDVKFNMIHIEGGTFLMGAQSEDKNGDNYDAEAWDSESHVHKVTLRDYYIGETPVTQELWQAVMGKNPSHFKGAKNPVESVSWEDCQNFIRKLNLKTRLKFRLPTEAEWEFAARGGVKSKGYKYSGSDNIDEVAWYTGNSRNTTHPVKQKKPNELGVYDMTGNVEEWCQDRYGGYKEDLQTNPTGPDSGSRRVFRGGSWRNLASYCRLSFRLYYYPDGRGSVLGLRLVLSEKQLLNEWLKKFVNRFSS